MDISEKLVPSRPRVVHGPHRLRMSGIARQPNPVAGEVMPAVVVGESEIASGVVEVVVETIPLDEPK